MASTIEMLATIFADVAGVDPSSVTADKHVFEDLGIDSLDFLDIIFDIDRAFSVKMPVEEWLGQVDEARSDSKLFTVGNIAAYIESQKVAA